MIYDTQKASFIKRLPAWMLDAILAIIVTAGVMAGLSYVLNTDAHSKALDDIYQAYEEKYKIVFTVTQEEMAAMSEEQLAAYQAAAEELSEDMEAKKAYEQVLSDTFLTVSLSLFASALLLEFLMPMWLGNGQTLGKKIFGVGVMRVDGIRVNRTILFVRAILGKYTLGTMIPVLLAIMLIFGILGMVGAIVLLVALLLEWFLPLVTRNRSAVHDLLACTVAVDINSQLIFDTPEEREEYIQQMEAENASEDTQ